MLTWMFVISLGKNTPSVPERVGTVAAKTTYGFVKVTSVTMASSTVKPK